MSSQPTKVGIREFREQLAAHLESDTPLVITRHGQTIGYYIPVRPRPRVEEVEALRNAARALDSLIRAGGASEEELVTEFKQLRRRGRRART